jgi:hypothetical protein
MQSGCAGAQEKNHFDPPVQQPGRKTKSFILPRNLGVVDIPD